MKLLIQGGRVIDPASGFDKKADLALADGVIVAIDNIAAVSYTHLTLPTKRIV